MDFIGARARYDYGVPSRMCTLEPIQNLSARMFCQAKCTSHFCCCNGSVASGVAKVKFAPPD